MRTRDGMEKKETKHICKIKEKANGNDMRQMAFEILK